MQTYNGKCVGGPYDGQGLAHTSRTFPLMRPMLPAGIHNADVPVLMIKIGEYKLNNFGQWHWWATEVGRAYDKLYGSPHVRTE